ASAPRVSSFIPASHFLSPMILPTASSVLLFPRVRVSPAEAPTSQGGELVGAGVAAVAAACPKAAGAAKPKTAIIEDMASNVVFIVVICEPDEDPWPKTVGAQTMAPVQILPV